MIKFYYNLKCPMKKIILLISLIIPFFSNANIVKEIKKIEDKQNIRIGVSAYHVESGKKFNYRANERFKMASTMKLPVAIYTLKLVQEGKLSLDQMVDLEPHDLSLGSGLLGYYLTYPKLSISLHNLLEPMMAISDNSATDAILKMVGGVKSVDNYLKDQNFKGINITNDCMGLYIATSGIENIPPKESWSLANWRKWISEAPKEQKRRAARAFYNSDIDSTNPVSMTNLLHNLFKGSLLENKYRDLLLENMQRCAEGERIPKLLPRSVKVAHKTGSWWDKNGKGYNYATFADIGVIYLPKKKGHLILSIFSESDKNAKRDVHLDSLAKISRLIYRDFVKAKK